MTAGRWTIAALLTLSVALSLVRDVRLVKTWSEDYTSATNLHVRQAAAFLRGQVALDHPGLDTALYKGRSYVPFPPGPALLFLPVVALFGERTSVAPAVCLFLTLLNIATLVSILKRLEIRAGLHFWLVLAFFFGSGYWYVLAFSEGVWFSESLVAVTALLLAIRESMTRRRGWVLGLCLGVAFLSRQVTILATPFIGLTAWEGRRHDPDARGLRWLASFAMPLAISVAMYLGFNAIRFDHYWDAGYRYLPLDGYELARRDRYGLFSLAYVPVNLFHLLLHGFTLGFDSPDRLTNPQADWFGTALPAASPFVLLAFFAPAKTAFNKAIWATVALMAFVHSMYYVSGAGQLNWQRYALDYWPMLFILIALGLQAEDARGRSRLWKGAIAYSVALNAFVLAYFDLFGRFLRVWADFFGRT